MKVRYVTTGIFQAHTYFLTCEETGETLLIDPGQEVKPILNLIHREDLKVTKLVGSHAHLDHVWSVADLKAATGAPFYLHPDDEPLYHALPDQGMWVGLRLPEPPPVDIYLKDGDVLIFGTEQLTVRHVPGHSPGHVMLYNATDAWVGDCLFESSIGRTDLPGGNARTLMNSIFERILPLGDTVKIHPGHGAPTTVEREKRLNPFLTGRVGSSFTWLGDE